MSWLQRNLFSRRRAGSQAKDNEKSAPSEAAATTTTTPTKPEDPHHTSSSNEKTALHRATLTYDVGAESESESEPEAAHDPPDASTESANDLFSRLSVAEVRQYEKTLQSHVDRIQKRMRRVATKHYHDLINAADSVVAMDASSVNITMKLTDLKSMLDDALAANSKGPTAQKSATRAPVDMQDDPQASVYAAAAQIKVLIDTPEQIWKALEARHFLQAALLYMIACKIHQRLSAEHRASTPSSGRRSDFGDTQARANPLPAFPVVERQWAAIASFRDQITAKAHQLLETADGVSIEASASSICAIALLEDVDAEMACTLYLTRRGQSLAPLLERIGAFSGEISDLAALLQELLGHVWQILADFVIIFGVPDDETDPMNWHAASNAGTSKRQEYASWMLTTLASLSADSDLPVSPSLQPLWRDKTAARNIGANNNNNSSSSEKRTAAASDTPESTSSETPKMAPRRLREGRSSASIKSRRRKSSIAGSVLSSTLTVSPLSESFHFDSLRSPVTPSDKTWSTRPQSIVGGPVAPEWVGAHALSDTQKPWHLSAQPGSRTSGMFIISKYLPEAIAQYRPSLARILDSEAVSPEAAMLDEAAEDEDDSASGLERFLDNPRRLLEVLATQIQPRLERTAAEALGLWWASISDNIRAAVTCAVEQRVLSVAEAAQIGSAMHKWESADTRIWLRGFSLVAISANTVLSDVVADGSSLYESLIEPLLRSRARMLLCSAMDRTLAIVDSFVEAATETDVAAGALPWRPLPLDGGSRSLELAVESDASTSLAMGELVEDIRSAANAEPLAASTLKGAVSIGLRGPWQDGERWWMQISGQAAFAEAMECSRHFVQQWQAMAGRLDQWAVNAAAEARKTLSSIENASIAAGIHGGSSADVPIEVLLCLKGAWAAAALGDAARALANDATPALVHECWKQLDVTPSTLCDSLHATRRTLLEPWLQFLGASVALAWAAEFDTLYYMIPRDLRADAAATRSDVVEAWTAVSQGTAWTTRYSALRRISATMAAEAAGQRRSSTPSTAVRGLAIAHRMRVQAVAGGLGVLGRGSSANQQQHSVAQAFAHTMQAVINARQPKASDKHGSSSSGGGSAEWDIAQLSADVDYVLQQLGQPASPSACEAGCGLLEAPCYQRLVALAG
ncbi:hypothetical protein LPJ59_000755 [Coemansia sp. RSA 2399]|nr:hypothetical protein LPJ59_000755 [Coemansia sp. RSA 2399]